MKSLAVMIGSKNTFLVAFVIIDLVFVSFAILAWSWGFHILMYVILASLAVNVFVQVPIYSDPKYSVSFMQHAVDDGFGNAIGKSDVQEHNAFLRFQLVNNFLFFINQLVAAGLIGIKYLSL